MRPPRPPLRRRRRPSLRGCHQRPSAQLLARRRRVLADLLRQKVRLREGRFGGGVIPIDRVVSQSCVLLARHNKSRRHPTMASYPCASVTHAWHSGTEHTMNMCTVYSLSVESGRRLFVECSSLSDHWCCCQRLAFGCMQGWNLNLPNLRSLWAAFFEPRC